MDKRTLRSKKVRPRNARQYDRPNQGIFGKVYSTMKGMLQPTWIFNSVSNWIGNNSEENPPDACADIEEETVREDNDIVSQSVSHENKKLRLRFEDNISSIQSSGTQTWPDQPPQNLYDSVSHVQSSTTQTPLLENKESIAVLNGDDHSENSEGSASTSGCSSLVSSHKDINKLVESPFHSLRSGLKNNRKRKEPSKSELEELNSSRTLWSSSFGASSKCQRRFPTISHTNQPSFNLSTFVGPSKLNESMDKKITSPFYEGRTTFGGASSSRRMPSSVTPYQVDKSLRNQIKVRDRNSEDNLEGMSSAAKRILLTLEKMSTPVADAKKIPNTKTSPVDLSVYLTPPKCRRNSQFTPTISSKGPPIANINTIAKLATLKNYGVSRLRNTLPGNSLTSVTQEGYNLDSLPSSSSDSVVQKSGGGKMKNKLNQHHQSSKDMNAENKVLETPDLPNIPLPITKLPIINFGTKVEKSVESNHSTKGFTFSNPIEHDLRMNNTVSTSSFALPSSFDSKTEKNSDLQPKPFVFSSPIEHELPNICVPPKENASLPVISTSGATSQSTWECSTCWVRNPSNRNSCIACEMSRDPKENSSASVNAPAGNPVISTFASAPSTSAFTFSQPSPVPVFTFGKSKASEAVTSSTFTFGSDSKTTTWECASCWVKNSEKDSKCIACEAVRIKKDNINTKTVDSSSTSNTSATWECSECWVRNSAKESKCLACESPRSTKEKSQGSTSVVNTSDKWECDACWVKNPSNESKCIACETVRSSKGNTEIKSSSSSNVFSTWECTSCWVRNPITEKKCKACETLHPSADKSSGFKDTNGFKFSSPIQNSPITFKFGNYVCTSPSTVTTSTFKFGIATGESQTTTNTTGFNCGAPSKTSTSSFFSTPATTDGAQNSKGITNENSTKSGADNVNEGTPKLDAVNESNTKISKVTEKEGFTAKTSETTSVQSGVNSEITNPLLVSKSAENKVLSSVITSASSETLVSKAKEVTTPSVTACFSFTTQPLLDSKKSETFPFGGPKEKLSSHSLSSPFTAFPTPSKDKPSEDEKSLHSEIKNTDAISENKLSSVFQPVSQSQQVSSAFTALTNAPVFKFGEKTDSSKINLSSTPVTTTSSFSFANNLSNYGNVTDSKVSEIGNAASETVPPASSVKADDKISSVTVSSASTTSSFVFGNTGTTSTPSAFSFFPPSSTSSTTSSSVFAFGASSNTVQASKSGGFTFKGLKKPPNVTSVSSVTTVSSAPQTTSSVLNLGASAPVPGGGFVFGTPKTEAQSTAATPFAFGSGAASMPTISAFSAFQPPQSTNATFQFGSQPTGSTSSAIGTSSNFAFAKSEMSNQVPSSVSQNPVSAFGSPASNFVFGAKSETANQIPSSTGAQAPGLAFGSATSSFSFANKTENTSTVSQNSNPTFGSSMPSVFGSTPVVTPFGNTDKPASSGFNFGGVSATSGVFQFGASNNTERKRPATGSGFSFGTPPASEPAGSFQANFNMSTPPSFNFGATSTPAGPGPFQFVASSAPKSPANQNAPRKYRKALRRVRKD